ncbi:MAG: sugar ABC transporter substrate-binding protein [Lawsonibacter sp.]|jgi:multiple sugar transport system substrate-binding protein|nr:sugar ABC transporter substrate-binding protein [Provencibacterium sp.]MCI8915033.1 sugar ABC transporter substrate-binding protein [Lawsonibacter sp.]
MNKKFLSTALCGALALSALAGCSSGQSASSAPASSAAASSAVSSAPAESGENISLRFMWWGGETRHKATVEALDLYTEQNPGVRIEYEYGGWDGYFDKLLTQLAGNNAPDIVQLSYTNASEYVVRDQLAPLDSYIESGLLRTDKLNQTLLDTYKIDGSYYAVPSGVNVQLLYYNQTMFDEFGISYPTSGMTFDEYYAKAKELNDAARAAGREDIWGMSAYTNALDVNFQRVLIDFGGQLWNDDLTAAAFNSPEGIQAIEYVKKPLDEGFCPPPEISASNPAGVTDFALGRVGMFIDNATSAAGLAETADFTLGMELAPFGNNKKVTWYQASQIFVITKQSANPEAAAKVIDYMLNDEAAGKILAYERGIPVNEDIRAASVEGKSEIEKKELELVDGAAEFTGDGVPMPFPPGYLDVHSEFERLQEAVMYGQSTPEEMMNSLESFANQTIGKFN